MNDEEEFYMVFGENGWTPPRKRHPHETAATTEAERLAKANPGQRFYVMHAVAVSHVAVPTITRKLKEPECPF